MFRFKTSPLITSWALASSPCSSSLKRHRLWHEQKTTAQRQRRAPLAILHFSVIVPSAAGWAAHKPCQTDLLCSPVLRIKDIKQGALA